MNTPSLEHLIDLLKTLPHSEETQLGPLLRAQSPADLNRIRDVVTHFISQLSEISKNQWLQILMSEFGEKSSFEYRESELIHMSLDRIISNYGLDYADDYQEQEQAENGDCSSYPLVSKQELDAELNQMAEERDRYLSTRENILSKIHF